MRAALQRALTGGGILIALILVSCSNGIGDGLKTGSAIRPLDLTASLTVNRAQADRQYGFAFPLLFNRTNRPIVIDGFKVLTVPRQVRLTRVQAFSTKRFGYLIGSHLGDGTSEDYSLFPNLYHPGRTSIPPHSSAHLMFAADWELVEVPKSNIYISGCRVVYSQASSPVRYIEDLPCRWGFSAH